ncbi:MAG: desulfoferrodoxin FeS4 iron-binding domain-containing protein, partial [Thermodesulfobacteriota bacterium]
MATQSGIYKCAVCGNIVEVIHAGDGELVCCGEPMQLLTENTTDASR